MIELPKDAEGIAITFDTECLYTHDGEKQNVIGFTYYRRKDIWEIETDMRSVNSIYLYITPPDSWEKLEEDLRRGADAESYPMCKYANGEEFLCSECRFLRGEGCCARVNKALADILDRIRKLRGEI